MYDVPASSARMVVRCAGLYCGLVKQQPLPRQFDTLSAEDLGRAIVHEKVSSLLMRRLREQRPEILGALCRQPWFIDARTRIEALVRHKAEVLSVIDMQARAMGIEVGAIKGLAAQCAYDDPDVRDLGDLDLMVADADEAIRLTDRLLALGYDFHSLEWPWVKRSAESGVIYGQFSLKHSGPQCYPAIDLHFGGYSIRHCGLHELAGGIPRPGLSYYGTQQNLPLIIGNAAGDHDITTKDLNDLAIALEDSAVDWARLLRELDAVCLLGFFKRVLEEFEATPLRPLYRDSVLPSLLKGVRREVPAPRAFCAQERRWAVTVLHACAVGGRHSYARAVITSATAARYYWGSRTVGVRSSGGRSVPRLPKLSNWTCVRLIPAAKVQSLLGKDDCKQPLPRYLPVHGPQRQLSVELTAVRSPIGDIVRTVLGDFFPVVYELSLPRPLDEVFTSAALRSG